VNATIDATEASAAMPQPLKDLLRKKEANQEANRQHDEAYK
jgi:hypothetical protein